MLSEERRGPRGSRRFLYACCALAPASLAFASCGGQPAAAPVAREPAPPAQDISIPESAPVVDASIARDASSSADASATSVAVVDAASAADAPASAPTAKGRCLVKGDTNVTAWSDAEWRECATRQCGPERGLANKLRVSVAGKSFTSGVTDVAKVTVENTSDAPVRVPFKWSDGRKFIEGGASTLLKADGKSYDTWDGACLGLATCAELVLEAHATMSWNAIVVPMKRHSAMCDRLRPTTPIPPGQYTLRVDTQIESDATIYATAPATVVARGSAPKP